jgi:hypothetical protein
MTLDSSDQVFILEGETLRSLLSRSYREVSFAGTNLEQGLQKRIEQYPELIPGAQIDPSSNDPPRFALLRPEMQIGSWSLDIILVDQYAVPTLVEAKLAENPESRRAVVGQIMEYAANASEAWSQGVLREKATEYWAKKNEVLDDVLKNLTADDDFVVDDFWNRVEENLNQNRLRLIVASDELRPEVRRIIEFLNMETRNIDVLKLEIRLFGHDQNHLVLVPRLGRVSSCRIARGIPLCKEHRGE